MPVTRREFIAGLGAITGIRFLSPIVVRAGEALGATLPDAATADRNRLIVVFQQGGNDGLNTVIPVAGARGNAYQDVRPSIAYDPAATLPLDAGADAGHGLALNPRLSYLHGTLYRDGRLAVVQGVDYPQHSYSHFVSTDIWESGYPQLPSSGWIGRHIDRNPPGEGELRGLGIGRELPLILQGESRQGVEVESIQATNFSDGSGAVGDARHAALERYANHPAEEPLRNYAGRQAKNTVELVRALEGVAAPPRTQNGLANALLTARSLLEGPFGVEAVFVTQPGSYDTHTAQTATHENLLTGLDQAIQAFYEGRLGGADLGIGALQPAVADRTIIVTISEFGRRVHDNGSGAVAGTDHGAAAPLFVVGPPAGATAAGIRLVPGLHGEHPELTTATDNLEQTTELRSVYQSVLQEWLADPDPSYEGTYEPLPGLFASL